MFNNSSNNSFICGIINLFRTNFPTLAENLFVFPEILLGNFILILLVYAIFTSMPTIKFINGIVRVTAITLCLIICNLMYNLSAFHFANDFTAVLRLWDQCVIDYFGTFLKLLLSISFIILLVILRNYLAHHQIYLHEYIFLMLTALLGSFLIISSNDFLFLYVAIELQALSFYALTGLNTKSRFSAEAAIKYFIIGSVASAIYLFGVAFLYGATGTTNFSALNFFLCSYQNFSDEFRVLYFSFIFILIGLLIKIGAAPFHMWIPDVYQGAPLPVTAFFSIVPKISFIAIFIRITYYSGGTVLLGWMPSLFVDTNIFSFLLEGLYSNLATNIFWLVGFMSILVSVVGGLGQTNIKRLFAYSSIGNVGFILLVLSVNGIDSLHAAIFYLVVYILLALNFFLILIALRYESRVPIVSIGDLSGLNSPVLASLMALNLFSLAGIPPLAGFYSKFYVYYILVLHDYYITTLLVIFFTVGSTFYYLRLINALFFVNVKSTSLATLQSSNFLVQFSRRFLKVRIPLDLAFFIVLTSSLNLALPFQAELLFSLLSKLVLLFF